jgi:hypothetical protein
MICQHCGAEVPDNSDVCAHCGAPLARPTNYRLNLGKLFDDTFDLYKQNFGTMCLIGLALLAIPSVFTPFDMTIGFMQKMANQETNAPLIITFVGVKACLDILQTIIEWYIALGIFRLCLYLARGGTGFPMSTMPPLMMYLKFAGLMLIMMCSTICIMPLIVPGAAVIVIATIAVAHKHLTMEMFALLFGGGVLLLISGGCVVMWVHMRLFLAQFFIADQNTSLVDSMKYAWRISSGNFWKLLLATLALGVLSSLGLLLCCVGVVFTLAITSLGSALAYLQLTGQPNCLDLPPPQ